MRPGPAGVFIGENWQMVTGRSRHLGSETTSLRRYGADQRRRNLLVYGIDIGTRQLVVTARLRINLSCQLPSINGLTAPLRLLRQHNTYAYGRFEIASTSEKELNVIVPFSPRRILCSWLSAVDDVCNITVIEYCRLLQIKTGGVYAILITLVHITSKC